MGAKGSGRYPKWVEPSMMEHVRHARRQDMEISPADFTPKGNLRKKARLRLYESAGDSSKTIVQLKGKKKDLAIYNILVEDHSGSMHSKARAALEGIQSHITTSSKLDKNVPNYTSRIKFENSVRVGEFKTTSEMKMPDVYLTGGGTSLNDALGAAINLVYDTLSKKKIAKYQINIVVFTDGGENTSTKYSNRWGNTAPGRQALMELVSKAVADGINIAVQGDRSASMWALALGIESSNVEVEDVNTSSGVLDAMSKRTAAMTATANSYASTGAKVSVGFFANAE